MALRLDDQLCFRIYMTTNEISRLYGSNLRPFKLTMSQYFCMLVLWERSPRAVSEISQSLGLTFGTVSPLLKRLETSGFIKKTRDSNDERRVFVHLTDMGVECKSRILEARNRAIAIMSLDDEETQSLMARLEQLSSNITAGLTEASGALRVSDAAAATSLK